MINSKCFSGQGMKLDAKKRKENGDKFSLVLRRCEAWKKKIEGKRKRKECYLNWMYLKIKK